MKPSNEKTDGVPPKSPPSSSATLWIGVGVVFALMALAWTAMFFFASKHRAADVPLPAAEGR